MGYKAYLRGRNILAFVNVWVLHYNFGLTALNNNSCSSKNIPSFVQLYKLITLKTQTFSLISFLPLIHLIAPF